MLTFKFTGADGKMIIPEILTSGMVGKQVRLEFSEEWAQMRKTAVFTAGGVTRDVVDPGEIVEIPAEVLARPMAWLHVGIYGVSDDGARVTPTIRAMGPMVHPGADPAEDPGVDPDLPVWVQIMKGIGDLQNLTTEAKENLVAAVNEVLARASEECELTDEIRAEIETALQKAKDSGEFDGKDGEKGEPGEQGPTGPQGPQGDKGEDGNSIHHCTYDSTLKSPSGSMAYSDGFYFPNGDPKKNDLFVTKSGYVGRIKSIKTSTSNQGNSSTLLSYQFVADLNGQDYVLTEDDKQEIAEQVAELVDVPDSTNKNYIELLPESSYPLNAMEMVQIDKALPLIAGKTYLVVWNGVSYECDAYKDGAGLTTLGADDYPFCIEYYDTDDTEVYPMDGSASVTLAVYLICEPVKTVNGVYPDENGNVEITLPKLELAATLEDGTNVTYKLYGEKVTE